MKDRIYPKYPASRGMVTILAVLSFQWIVLPGWAQPAQKATQTVSNEVSVATAWADLTVRVMTAAPQNTPTYGSRALGYLGLTMYETVVGGSRQHRSVAGQLCDTLRLPKPIKGKVYNWVLALNMGQLYGLTAFYGYTNRLEPAQHLADSIRAQHSRNVPADVVARSEAFGRVVATRLAAWAEQDGGHEGYKRNFPADYVIRRETGLWVPPVVGQSNVKLPMHPTWGQNRTFSPKNGQLPLAEPMPYSEDTSSVYFRQYREVYTRNTSLTPTERETVYWWGDDPTETCSPPGHSYNLATIAIRNSHVDLVRAAQTYARVGMAVADAFICCWKAKFTYLVQRPSSYINKYVPRPPYEGQWLPFFLEPPFPSFYSGHAVQSAATAAVLTSLYGNSFSFTDDTHAHRPDKSYLARILPDVPFEKDPYSYYLVNHERKAVAFKPRRYASFWDAAQECANSRLLGGIHTRHDNDVGLAEGRKIGDNINRLGW